jgi:hypothetical protein
VVTAQVLDRVAQRGLEQQREHERLADAPLQPRAVEHQQAGDHEHAHALVELRGVEGRRALHEPGRAQQRLHGRRDHLLAQLGVERAGQLLLGHLQPRQAPGRERHGEERPLAGLAAPAARARQAAQAAEEQAQREDRGHGVEHGQDVGLAPAQPPQPAGDHTDRRAEVGQPALRQVEHGDEGHGLALADAWLQPQLARGGAVDDVEPRVGAAAARSHDEPAHDRLEPLVAAMRARADLHLDVPGRPLRLDPRGGADRVDLVALEAHPGLARVRAQDQRVAGRERLDRPRAQPPRRPVGEHGLPLLDDEHGARADDPAHEADDRQLDHELAVDPALAGPAHGEPERQDGAREHAQAVGRQRHVAHVPHAQEEQARQEGQGRQPAPPERLRGAAAGEQPPAERGHDDEHGAQRTAERKRQVRQHGAKRIGLV